MSRATASCRHQPDVPAFNKTAEIEGIHRLWDLQSLESCMALAAKSNNSLICCHANRQGQRICELTKFPIQNIATCFLNLGESILSHVTAATGNEVH